VSGVIFRIQQGISPGYGYSAIIIAWLAKLNPWAVIPVSVLFAGLLNGGFAIQTSKVPAAYTPAWTEHMTAGLGWIAFVLVIFATWNPLRLPPRHLPVRCRGRHRLPGATARDPGLRYPPEEASVPGDPGRDAPDRPGAAPDAHAERAGPAILSRGVAA
jgi:hypothetical protein